MLCAAWTVTLAVSAPAPAEAWQTAHGQPDNTHFANVTTKPAVKAFATEKLGTVSLGSGPVIAPDGTVYVGTEEGWLIAMHADGGKFWSRRITPGESIIASPAIGSDGTIYVIGVRKPADGKLNRRVRFESTLHRFLPGGAWLGGIPLPDHGGAGAAGGAPNIWRHNGVEAVIVSAIYKNENVPSVTDLRVIAFAPNGGVLDDVIAISVPATIVGAGPMPGYLFFGCIFIFPCTYPPAGVLSFTDSLDSPIPGVSVFTNPNGGVPWIIATDFFKSVAGLTFSNGKLYKNFEYQNEDILLRSAPISLPNGHTLIGFQNIDRNANGAESGENDGGLIFTGPNMIKVAPVDLGRPVFATPTRLLNGNVIVPTNGSIFELRGAQVIRSAAIPKGTRIAAAASRNHIFLNTPNAFITLDALTLEEVGRRSWGNGGKSPPAIGPDGRVYAIAGGILHVFPDKLLPSAGTTAPGAPGSPGMGPVGGVYQDAGIPANAGTPTAPTAQSQSYKPPMTPNNNRLFACEELDGDDCGKGDHRAISLAFCMKQGFTKADDFDVDSKKVRAETLSGQFCSKSKCKVFDEIVCSK